MPPLPPQAIVLEKLHQIIIPAAGSAALVMCLFALLGRWAGALGSAAAVAAGFIAANYEFDKPSWTGGKLLPWTPEADSTKPWEWLPRAAFTLLVVGLLSRWLGLLAARYLPEKRWWVANLVVWLPRIAAVAAVSAWLISTKATAEFAWLRAALIGVIALEWIVLDSIARTGPGVTSAPGFYEEVKQPAGEWTGAGGQSAAYQAAIFLSASMALLYASWASGTEVFVILGSAMFGVATAAGVSKVDASGAVPAVVFLPVLMLSARLSTDSTVPLRCFWLVGLAPLALTPFLIPRLARHNGWKTRIARVILVLAPVVAALVIAGQHAELVFE